MSSTDRHSQGQQHDKGKNLGQGLANITDKQRRDLAGTGDDAPTQDQRREPRSGHQNAQDRGQDAQGRGRSSR